MQSGMSTTERATILITVKAYPQLGMKSGETVCVAGIRVDRTPREFIRLWPVTFRDLPKEQQFKKYDLIEATVFKSGKDQRPESWTPIADSIQIIRNVRTNGNWRERWTYVDNLVDNTDMCHLNESARQLQSRAQSLALIKPRQVIDVDVSVNAGFNRDKALLAQQAAEANLFRDEIQAIESAPYLLKYHYLCADPGCKSHNQTLVDWELGQAGRRWRDEYDSAETTMTKIREKFFDSFFRSDRDSYLFVGNQHQYPGSFLTLGVFWPPNGSRPNATLFED